MSTHEDPIHGGVPLSPPTSQRKLVEEAWERAKAASKRLIIRPVGAWSEQCLMFDAALEHKGDELKQRTDRAEYIVLDERDFDRGHAIDWLPAEFVAFHTVYLVDPTVGRSSFTIITNVTDAGILTQYLDLWYGTDDLRTKLRQLVLDYSPEQTSIPFAHLAATAAHTTGYSEDLPTTMGFIKALGDLKEKREDLFAGVDLEAIAIRSLLNLLHAGRVTLDELQKAEPEWTELILSNNERVIEVKFYIATCTAARKLGFQAAAEVARKSLDEIRPTLPREPMPYLGGAMVDTAGVEAKLVSLQRVLEALGGTLTLKDAEAWTQHVLAQNYEFFFLLEIPEIFFALEDYGRAAELVEHTLPRWTDFYGNVVNQLQAMIDGAPSGQEAMAEQLKAMLPFVKKIPEGTVAAQTLRIQKLRQRASATA
ncbi:MAG TPA: hypothetical protein VLS89_13795 [Candidatus Nanopelagicales bacterium]|nr:hypothetical protein [Candidatus Nanopelagicales bacterium]